MRNCIQVCQLSIIQFLKIVNIPHERKHSSAAHSQQKAIDVSCWNILIQIVPYKMHHDSYKIRLKLLFGLLLWVLKSDLLRNLCETISEAVRCRRLKLSNCKLGNWLQETWFLSHQRDLRLLARFFRIVGYWCACVSQIWSSWELQLKQIAYHTETVSFKCHSENEHGLT